MFVPDRVGLAGDEPMAMPLARRSGRLTAIAIDITARRVAWVCLSGYTMWSGCSAGLSCPDEAGTGTAAPLPGTAQLQENAMKPSRVAIVVLATLALLTPRLPADDKSDRAEALEAIKKLKGTVVSTTPLSVSFDNKGITDDDLVPLQKLPDLQELYLRKCKITDKGLEKLAGFTKLTILNLGNTAVTDKGLEQLKGLTRLQNLNLVGTQVTDEGLAHLKDLKELRVLETKGSKVTPAGIAELKKSLPKLVVR
jgi:hypothetical protein